MRQHHLRRLGGCHVGVERAEGEYGSNATGQLSHDETGYQRRGDAGEAVGEDAADAYGGIREAG